jgi:homopolymeric O-antigen transport system ATP-binding protein
MADVALRMEHVYKKFRKGEGFNSLRDLVPALTGRMFQRQDLAGDDQREFWALQDVSFEVKHGEAFGIIGHNGAGKSTILKILSRIMKPTKGNMAVNGRLSALLEVSAGFHQDLTGRENIFLNGTILGMNRREIESKLDQIISFSELEEFIDTPVKRYSSGMYARLGFSVAAHVDPEVLIVDEVLSVGDHMFQKRCMERMSSILKGGTTVLFVSHNLNAVSELCSRAMLLKKGEVAIISDSDSVVRHYLKDAQQPCAGDESEPVYISKVKVSDELGERSTFESGQTAWIDVEVTARERVHKLAILLLLADEGQYQIFRTSTEVLGHSQFCLDPGERYRCRFALSLNMGQGTFYLDVAIGRYDIQKLYHRKALAATVFIRSTSAVRGAVNCFPRLVEAETVLDSRPQDIRA